MIIYVVIINTIGIGFWFFVYIYLIFGLVEVIWEEVKVVVECSDIGEVIIDIVYIVEKCFFLVVCYCEFFRLINQFIGNR